MGMAPVRPAGSAGHHAAWGDHGAAEACRACGAPWLRQSLRPEHGMGHRGFKGHATRTRVPPSAREACGPCGLGSRSSRLPSGALIVGRTGWREFDPKPTLWDAFAGREMPDVSMFVGASVDVWATLTDELVQSKWAPGTRALYQGWLAAFLVFCAWCSVAPLPINPHVLSNFITRVAVNYCYSTVQVAASAVIGFCLMNNFEHPLKQHPVCKLAVDGAKRIKCGVLKARRAAVDAPFVLDMWRVCAEMRGLGIYSIVNRRAKCFTQLAFEAALRGGEVCGLKVCDLIFTACGPRCGLECKAPHRGSDALLFCRMHKTAATRNGAAKVLHLVGTLEGTTVGGKRVSALSCLLEEWLPFLRQAGLVRREGCKSSYSTKFRCEVCPELFPTFPSRKSGVTRPIDVSAFTSALKRFAVLTDRDPTGYSSHSTRIGSYSGITAEGCLPPEAAKQLGWASEKVPEQSYKNKTAREARAPGVALQSQLSAAAKGAGWPAAGSPQPAQKPPRRSPHRSQGPKPKRNGATAQHKERRSTVQHAPSEVSCEDCGRPFPATPCVKHPDRQKRFCEDCWQQRLAQRSTQPAVSSRPGALSSFPLTVTEVAGKRVCVGYQLGTCNTASCAEAHVCHGCGVRHTGGALCSSAIRVVSRWRAEQVRRAKAGRR